MIRCTPLGICSWSFELHDDGAGKAETAFGMGETGTVVLGGTSYTVVKHGLTSGHWTLEQGDRRRAAARKGMSRRFELETQRQTFTLAPRRVLSNEFVLERGDATVARIRRVHPLTRRSTIETTADAPELEVLAFAFWLVALCWRRASRASS